MAFGPIKNPSKNAIDIARGRAIRMSAEAPQGKKERAKSLESPSKGAGQEPGTTLAPSWQADAGAKNPESKCPKTKTG